MPLCRRNIGTMSALVEGHARARVEEEPVVAVGHVEIVLVSTSPHAQIHIAELEVDVGREPFERAVLTADIGVVLLFESAVVVPEVTGVEFLVCHAVRSLPVGAEDFAVENLSEVSAVVARPTYPGGDTAKVSLAIEVGLGYEILVVHALVDNEVRGLEARWSVVSHTIFLELLAGLVLVVPAVALGVVKGCAPA